MQDQAINNLVTPPKARGIATLLKPQARAGRRHAGATPQAGLAHLNYRPDIDGLRSLAVMSVVLFHAFPRWLAGGYVGVDIFFVISGFLISSILFKSLAAGTFSFADFYARRARRIFPALVAVLAATAAFGWYVLTPDEFATLGKHIASGSAFIGNVSLWLETGYFDTAADVKPLLHLWSLGVEEQFYIVWPVLLWAAWKRHWNLLAVCAVLGAVSFAVNVAYVKQHADAVFFLSFTRFWELLAGAALAYATVQSGGKDIGHLVGGRAAGLVRNAVSLGGAVALLWAIYVLDKSHAFPGWWAMVPVAGAVMVIAAGPQALVNRWLLGNRPMAWLGLISYPLYLWHWPLLVYGKIVLGHMSKEMRFGLIGMATLLALLTYQFIEKRLRRPAPDAAPAKNRQQLVGLYGAVAACCALGMASFYGILNARSNAEGVDTLLEAQLDWDYPPRTFAKFAVSGPNFFTRSGTAPGYTVFIGDSLMEQYATRVEQLLADPSHQRHSVIFATGPGCPALPKLFYIAAHTHPACAEINRQAYLIAQRPDVRKVVIGGDWARDLAPPNPELEYRSASGAVRLDSDAAFDAVMAGLDAQVAALVKTKQVYLLLNSPKSGEFSPKSMLDGTRWTQLTRRQGQLTADVSDFYAKTEKIRKRVHEIAQRHGAKVIDPVPALCKGTLCPTVAEDGRPLFMDMSHMRPYYVRDKASYIDATVQAEDAAR